jgi:transcription termination factor Rho
VTPDKDRPEDATPDDAASGRKPKRRIAAVSKKPIAGSGSMTESAPAALPGPTAAPTAGPARRRRSQAAEPEAVVAPVKPSAETPPLPRRRAIGPRHRATQEAPVPEPPAISVDEEPVSESPLAARLRPRPFPQPPMERPALPGIPVSRPQPDRPPLGRPLPDRQPLDRPVPDREQPERQLPDRPLPSRSPHDRQPPNRPRYDRPRVDDAPGRGERDSNLERRIDRIQREREAARYHRGGGRRPEPPRVDLVQNRSALARIPPSRSAMGGGGSRSFRGGRDSRKRDLLEGLNMLHRGVSVDPYQRLVLETVPENLSTRVVDLIAPIGRGQRCLITSPPKAGKTMLLMTMAEAIIHNHPEVTVVVLLVDERPEEVTFFRRGVPCEVMASSNDMTPEDHVRTAEETVVRVADLVTEGKDVVLFLDSITRLARAYNVFAEGSGRTMSGGIDASTMYGPRRIFGAARKIEHGGSLTICGTALIDTGSRMDEVIFQEFKGTGNTEIVLSRDLANKRIFPSIDIILSGSRKEEKLYPVDVVSRIHILRRFLADRKPEEAMLGLMKMMERYPTNRDLLRAVGT